MRRAALYATISLAVLLAAGTGAYVTFSHGDLLKEAETRLARGDARGAEIDLDAYLRTHPGNPVASFQLGSLNLQQGNLVAAERLLKRARAGGYNPAEIVLPLGETYLQQRRYEDVLDEFTVQTAPPGGKADTLSLRASAYLALHKVQEAHDAAEAAQAAAPGRTNPIIVAARIDVAMNDINAAASKVGRLLARDPKMPDAVLLDIDLRMRKGDPQGALKVAQGLLADSPSSPAAKMAVARALAALDRDVEALKLANDVVRRLPRDIGANYLKMRLADRQHDFASADSSLSVLLPVIDDLPQGEYFVAVTKLGINQPAQGQEAAAKWVAQHPSDVPGMKLLAFAELALQRPDRADAALRPLMASGHPDADTLDLSARADALRGDMKDAEQKLAQAAAMQPGSLDILNRLGAARVQLGDTDAGEADLRRSLAQAPDQPRAATALVQTALASGDIRGAAAEVERLRKAIGDAEVTGVLDGQVHVARMDLPGARAIYEDVLKRFPESRDATFGLVQVEGRMNDTKNARARLTGWMTMHPTDKGGLKLLVTADMVARDPSSAIAAVEAAQAAAPNDLDVDEALAHLYLSAKMPEKAVDLLERCTEGSAGRNTALLALKGEALIAAGRMEDAQAVLGKAVETTPADLRARLAQIDLFTRLKDFDSAHHAAQSGLDIMPGNPRLMQALVEVDSQAHGIAAGLKTASALQKDPRNMPAALMLPGLAMAETGDKQGAAQAFLDAYRQAPSEPMALTAAAALDHAGRPADGRALMRDYAQSHPDSPQIQRILASQALADHKTQEAADRLTRVLQATPSDAASLNNMAWVHLDQNDAAGARPYAQRAYYISPGPETEDTLGWTMARAGDVEGGLPLLEQAATVKPTQQILYHYAFALHGEQRIDDARAALAKALANKTAFEERPQAEQLQASIAH